MASDQQGEQHESAEEFPTREELREPSTEKDPGEEPKAPVADDAETDHQAVGIGVIGGPQVDEEAGV